MPSEVAPLKTSICKLNWPGPSAWIKAPAPDTFLPKVSVSGPLPPFPLSEVQIRLSPAVKPEPVQLHGVATQSTERMLPLPVRPPVTARSPTDVAAKLAGIDAWSPPNCDQFTESVAPWAPGLVTVVRLSAQTVVVADKSAAAKAQQTHSRLDIGGFLSLAGCRKRMFISLDYIEVFPDPCEHRFGKVIFWAGHFRSRSPPRRP